MSKSSSKGRGPKPKRVALLVRVDAADAERIKAVAERSRRSVSQICAGILSATCKGLVEADKLEASPPFPPEVVVDVFGGAVARELAKLGVLSDFAASAFDDDVKG